MKRDLMTIDRERDLGENPLINDLMIPVTKFYSTSFKVDEDGVILNDTFVVEDQKPVSVYSSPEIRKKINNLPIPSCRMLLWLQQSLIRNKDYIWINRERYMKEVDCSLNTYKAAVEHLVKTNFLGLTLKKDVYWINPAYFFPGSRVKAFPSRLEVKRDLTNKES